MSVEIRWLAEAIPMGQGLALDLGGGRGTMRALVERKGWQYINLDLQLTNTSLAVGGDAHALPFQDSVFSLIITKDALEHFENPPQALCEVRRVLKDSGTLVIWVPFMHPFHGDDYYRYTPLALEKLLKGFRVLRFDAPFWVFSVVSLAVVEVFIVTSSSLGHDFPMSTGVNLILEVVISAIVKRMEKLLAEMAGGRIADVAPAR